MITITKKGHWGHVEADDNRIHHILRESLCYKNKWYPNMPEWAKKTYLYNINQKKFRWGLIYRVEKILKKLSMQYKIISPELLKVFNDFKNPELRPYQQEAVKTFFKYGMGIFQLACASGKTYIALEIVNQLQETTLVIVHTKELKKQWEDYHNPFIRVFTYQGLVRKINKENASKFNMVIADECHLCKCTSIKQIFNYLDCNWILGLSASPEREDKHDMQIEECVGQVIYHKTTKELIDEGYISDAVVQMTDIDTSDDYFETYNELYESNIVLNDERNQRILEITQQNKDKKVLILVDRIEHGQLLKHGLDILGIHSVFYHSKMKKRKQELELIQAMEYDVIIATQIFDTGIDFPWLEVLILASGGKSSVKIIQRVGRLLRLFDGKEKALIYDFMDGARVLRGHTRKRLNYYHDCGFKVI